MGILRESKVLDLERRSKNDECEKSLKAIQEKFDNYNIEGKKLLFKVMVRHLNEDGLAVFETSANFSSEYIDRFYEEVSEWVRSVKEDLGENNASNPK